MVKYDATVLQQFADSLYAKARSIVINYAIFGLILGGGCGLVVSSLVHSGSRAGVPMLGTLLWAIPTIMGLAVGISIGQMKAFMLRLEAQRTLCQVQIEANTRQISDVQETVQQRQPTKG